MSEKSGFFFRMLFPSHLSAVFGGSTATSRARPTFKTSRASNTKRWVRRKAQKWGETPSVVKREVVSATPIYKPWKGHLEGEPQLGELLAMGINQPLTNRDDTGFTSVYIQ